MKKRPFVAATLLAATACGGEARIDVEATWGMPPRDRPVPGEVYIHPAVILPDGSRIESEPFAYRAGVIASIDDVPVGDNRTVEIVVREGPESDAVRCCSGQSQLLKLETGVVATAKVTIQPGLNLVVEREGVSWIRSPVGQATDEDLGAFIIPAGPYFAIAPFDGLANTDVVMGNNIRFGGFVAPHALEISNAAQQIITRVEPDAEGNWPRAQLDLGDTDPVEVHLRGIGPDEMKSASVRIINTWLVDSTAPSVAENVWQTARAIAVPLGDEVGIKTSERDRLAGPDGQGVGVGGAMAWVAIDRPGPRGSYGMALDTDRERIVMFGGNAGLDNLAPNFGDTWEWDGTRWIEITPTDGPSPSPRYGTAMAYDGQRQQFVLFGGSTGRRDEMGRIESDTWLFDGQNWSQASPANAPQPRLYHSMAFDESSGTVVLYGGSNDTDSFDDTWIWDGVDWTQSSQSRPPSKRSLAAMTYDASLGAIVLSGGIEFERNSLVQSDTWIWDGATWTQQFPAQNPGPRFAHAIAYHPALGRTVLLGGATARGVCCADQTWTYDGTTWRREPGATVGRAEHGLAYDPSTAQLITFGGGTFGGQRPNDTMGHDGVTWSSLPSITGPSARELPAMVTDPLRNEVLLIGGITEQTVHDDFWRWNGETWTEQGGARPSRRAGAAAVHDRARDRVVLFGGTELINAQADTWEWDGVGWADVTVNGGRPPPGRFQFAMAYDAGRGVAVVHGGRGASGVLSDVWEWDGSQWRNVTPAGGGPGPRWAHQMAYDEVRGQLVLFGGFRDGNGRTLAPETWVRTDEGWSRRSAPTGAGQPRGSFGMLYDPSRETVIRFGGISPEAGFVLPFTDTWEWSGEVWFRDEERSETPNRAPWLRQGQGLAFDPARQQPLMFGGVLGGRLRGGNEPVLYLDDTVVREPVGTPALQLTHHLTSELPDEAIVQVVVRAFCSGASVRNTVSTSGADLLGFFDEAWQPLDTNEAADTTTASSLLSWTSSDEDEAKSVAADNRVDVQCRPRTVDGADTTRVFMDYAESRVLYAPR